MSETEVAKLRGIVLIQKICLYILLVLMVIAFVAGYFMTPSVKH